MQLGLMYWKGQGIPQDYKKAYVLLSVSSATDGQESHIAHRDLAAEKLSPEQLVEAQAEATALFEKIQKWKK